LTSEQFAGLDLQLTEASLGGHSHSQAPNGFKVAHLSHFLKEIVRTDVKMNVLFKISFRKLLT